MKLKIILMAMFLVSLFIVILIAIRTKMPATVTVTTFPQAYNCVGLIDEEDSFTVEIMVNTKKSFIDVIENIVDASICNDNEFLRLKPAEIKLCSEPLYIRGNKYFLYCFVFLIDFTPETEISFEINPALLQINYSSGAQIKLNIGTFSYYKYQSFGSAVLSVVKLRGVVNDIDDTKTLAAVEIGLRNDSENNLRITAVKPLDLNLLVSGAESVVSEDLEFKSADLIADILDKPYYFFAAGTVDFSYRLEPNENISFLFPLKYHQLYSVNKLGFIVEYESDYANGKLVYDDFTFFQTNEYSRKAIDELVFYTYENH